VIRGVYLFLATLFRVLAAAVPGIIASRRGTLTRAEADARLARLFQGLVDGVGAKIEVSGREHLPASGPFLVMSNHQSLWDIPVVHLAICGCWPLSLRMIAKKEMFELPVIGTAMKAADFVAVDRKDPEQAARGLAEARRKIAEGVVMWIAPEGTRSRDGVLGPFKRGGFLLAARARVPVIPVTLDGTRDILAAGSVVVHPGVTVRVTLHPPVDPEESLSRGELMERVRTAIESSLPARARMPAPAVDQADDVAEGTSAR